MQGFSNWGARPQGGRRASPGGDVAGHCFLLSHYKVCTNCCSRGTQIRYVVRKGGHDTKQFENSCHNVLATCNTGKGNVVYNRISIQE